ncbi:hypothetical protein AB0P41_21180 [Streptomyces sp. NPDC079167]|uniref:hypothetical protein n=1 Tax=Streptomyces sp. NPDC079167 TaxID=3154513 RepID=UPI0034203120
MNLRSIPLVFVALLSTAGCVSVQAEAERPSPSASVRPGNVPAAQAPTAPTEPAAVHDTLGRTEKGPDRAEGGKRKKEKGSRAPARRADVVAPPVRQEARNQPRRAAPDRPRTPRGVGAPHRARPDRTYDMRTVCASGRGVASAEIVDLCRTTYGR